MFFEKKPAEKEQDRTAPVSEAQEWISLAEVKARYVTRVLQHTRGNKQAAARVLGVDRKTLDRMIKRYRIELISDLSFKI